MKQYKGEKGEDTVHSPSLPIPHCFLMLFIFSPFSYKSQTLQQALTSSLIANYLAGKCLFHLLVVPDKCKKKGTIEASKLFSRELFGEKDPLYSTQRIWNLKKSTKQVNETLPLNTFALFSTVQTLPVTILYTMSDKMYSYQKLQFSTTKRCSENIQSGERLLFSALLTNFFTN